jgi:signal transduction histidine kinase
MIHPAGDMPAGREPGALVRNVDLERRGFPADALSDVSGAAGDGLDPLAALVHDLRSPLAALSGFARLAREDLRAGDLARASLALDRVERSAAMLAAVLSAADRPSGSTPAADLSRVVDQIAAERKSDLERRGIRLLAPTRVPPIAIAEADLYRLLGNLIGNAIDHMGEARDPAIRVSLRVDGALATIQVSDNGPGIPLDCCERVFEVAHTRHAEGSMAREHGLGLAIVRTLAERWGGRAWVEPSRAPGATLCVSLPVAR